jgi:hypothetical protein
MKRSNSTIKRLDDKMPALLLVVVCAREGWLRSINSKFKRTTVNHRRLPAFANLALVFTAARRVDQIITPQKDGGNTGLAVP